MLRNNGVQRCALRALGAAIVVAAVALTGCTSRSQVHVVHPSAKVVVIEKGHTHYKRCGHFRHGKKWYYSHGHVHKKFCGHKKVRGGWVLP